MFESAEDHPAPTLPEIDANPDLEYWRRRSEESQALIARLTARLRGRDRRIRLLELAISRTAVMHHVWATHLERRLERLPLAGVAGQARRHEAVSERESAVIVDLPHLTHTLEALFDVMREHWSEWDPERPPKSSTVARAIDEKLGLKGQANGEASRSAQTFAAALRPDSVVESDGRHR
ncbi:MULTISPECIES: hypothetical protein [unclassified Paraburkholderia]|uniref:hypothetical protein n=1 Tax=unclassified Paraburkholderia TaxID=2615204 RepID=UPI001611365F|nr:MULTISPECIES: hypothetical protein [unclassified Paraburkholderia]MBB5447822.1 hypothetical protein [Paraburkholderia sp. WSM4177]MBB5488241.1 hypothetical protein [Paraburkholderia sp. WSM4180]